MKNIRFAIVVLLVVSMPYYMQISNVLLVLAAIISLWEIHQKRSWKIVKIDCLSFFLFSYFLIELIGLFYTDYENINYGFSAIEKHQAFVLFPIAFFDLNLSAKNRRITLIAFILSCLVASIFCVIGGVRDSLLVYGQYFNDWMFSHDRLAEQINMQPVYFSMFISLAVLMIFFLLIEEWNVLSILDKGLLLLLLFFFFIMIVSLGGRTIIIALMLILTINFVIKTFERKNLWMMGGAILIPVFFTFLILLHPTIRIRFLDMAKSKYASTNYGSYFARTKIWEPGLELVKENIWFGVGTGDHQIELDKKFIKYDYKEGVQVYNMHNQYLQTLLTYGVIGFIGLCCILCSQVTKGFQNRDFLYLSFLMVFILACLTESMLNRNKGIIFFLLFSFIFFKSEIKKTLVDNGK